MPEAHKHTLFQFQSRQVPTQKIRQSNVNESDFLILNRVLKTLFFYFDLKELKFNFSVFMCKEMFILISENSPKQGGWN